MGLGWHDAWLVVWNMNFMTFHLLGIVIPTDFHIFQRGRYTTNQMRISMALGWGCVTGARWAVPFSWARGSVAHAKNLGRTVINGWLKHHQICIQTEICSTLAQSRLLQDTSRYFKYQVVISFLHHFADQNPWFHGFSHWCRSGRGENYLWRSCRSAWRKAAEGGEEMGVSRKAPKHGVSMVFNGSIYICIIIYINIYIW